ncbi:MAG: ribosome silencing factor [Oscillospiraceae bacterium]
MNSLELTKAAVKILDEKKAENIEVLKVDNLTILADYFIIASTTNSTHVKSLADELEFLLKQQGRTPKKVEGYQNTNWIIVDYQDVIVHIFHQEMREYYNLERLWADGEKIDISEILK